MWKLWTKWWMALKERSLLSEAWKIGRKRGDGEGREQEEDIGKDGKSLGDVGKDERNFEDAWGAVR